MKNPIENVPTIDRQAEIAARVVDIESLDLSSVKALYLACKWDWLESDSEMHTAFKNSWRLFVALSRDDKVIGFGRIVSDGKIYGLLIDFVIHPEFRQRGYGQELLKTVIEHCKKEGLKVLQLLASREGFSLYQRAGFIKCPEESPGMIKILER